MPDTSDAEDCIPAEEAPDCELWHMPVLTGAANVVSTQGRKRGRAPEEDLFTGPLTASKIEKIREDAYQEGLQQGAEKGFQQGMQRAEAEINERLARLDSLLNNLAQPIAEQDEQLEQALVNLTTNMARAITHAELNIDSSRVTQVVSQALSLVAESAENIRVLVNPRDLEPASSVMKEEGAWKLVPDADIAPGGCIVKTDHSYIDFTLDAQLQLTVEEMVQAEYEDVTPPTPDPSVPPIPPVPDYPPQI